MGVPLYGESSQYEFARVYEIHYDNHHYGNYRYGNYRYCSHLRHGTLATLVNQGLQDAYLELISIRYTTQQPY